MNIRDKVKLVDRSNLIKLGYDLSDIPEDVVYEIDYIYSSDLEHYYKKELETNNLYSVEELKEFKVYKLSHTSYNICVIDSEIKKVGSGYVKSCNMTDKMLNDIIGAYIVFGSQFSDMIDGSDGEYGIYFNRPRLSDSIAKPNCEFPAMRDFSSLLQSIPAKQSY